MSKFGKGMGASRAESLAVMPDGPTQFRRNDCETCGKETIFKGLKCASCGTFRKMVNARGEVIDYSQKALSGKAFIRHKKIQRWIRSLRVDKSNYYAQKAAESRAKWEGKK